MNPLLTENDPALFDVINANGAAPLLVCCDHAGRGIPQSLGDLGLHEEFLQLHIAYDIGARQVALMLSQKFDAPLLLANYSRLVIDLNRHLDDATLIPEFSDKVAVPGNTGLLRWQRQQRVEEIFNPYHKQYSEMVDRLRARFVKPLILSVHSFTPEIDGVSRPWDFGVLWEEHYELAQILIRNLGKNRKLFIGENRPYHARDPLGYSMVVHAQERGVEMGLIEIRQDRIEQPDGQKWATEILHQAVLPVLDHSQVQQVS